MPHKYFLIFGTLLFMALGETVGTVAAAIRPLAPTAPTAIGPYAKRKPIKAQFKHKKTTRHKGRPLVRII
ncbi:hypothetical protein [Hymenobacter sp. HDW8]|uniref:hypothetical protein n=1 Tax=Hymenobacter sp. HDW8 TaxID=2714932 RepID=UPI00140ABCE1|nr:hypothetical protein [Hymenobacter sp. HDW8]QIL76309.1 hypothetical protein G7064_10885 [Hymenobacter sp. HDW8]